MPFRERFRVADDPGAIGKHYGVERSVGIGDVQFDRSATIGSIREARQAGMYPATAATTISNAPTPTYVTGSPEVTPNSRLPSVFDNARDAAMPNASPNVANPNVRKRMRRCNLAGD